MYNVPDTLAAVQVAEEFAGMHVDALKAALDGSSGHASGPLAQIAPRPLLVAHVVGLFGQLNMRRGGAWQTQYSHLCSSRMVALHVWLYHLGPVEFLEMPSGKAAQSKELFRIVERKVQLFVQQRHEFVSQQKLRVARGQDTSNVDMKLQKLCEDMLEEFNWKILPAAGAPPPPPSPPPAGSSEVGVEDKGWKDVCLMVARGVCSPGSPLHILQGHADLLTQICWYACKLKPMHFGSHRRNLPQKETLRALYLSHSRVVALREQLDDRDTLIRELRALVERTARREAAALRMLEEARAQIVEQRIAAEREKQVSCAECGCMQDEPLWSNLDAWLLTVRVVVLSQDMMGEAKQQLKKRERELNKKQVESDIDWQLLVNRLENDKADAMREMDRNRREEIVELARMRDMARAQAGELDRALERERAATDKLRELRGGSSWLEQRAQLREENQQLKRRRTLNQKRLACASLAEQRARASAEANRKTQSRLAEMWQSDEFYTADQVVALQAHVAKLQMDKEAMALEITKLKEITHPSDRYFYQSGHFSATVDLAIIQCLQLGINRTKVPALFFLFARFFRVTVPMHKRRVRGPDVEGKRTAVERVLLYLPSVRHVKDVSGMMYQLNKFQVGEWILDYLNSDEETSCCYLADGAESLQVDHMGQLLSRRVDGKLEIKALDLNALASKTAEAQAQAWHDSIESVVAIMEKAGTVDVRAASLMRKFVPTCGMNDRNATARAATRKVLGLQDGDDDPTCAEHALVNVLEEGRKAMDRVLRGMMNITDEQAETDAAKIKAMRTCVGWFSSPACALIYQASNDLNGAHTVYTACSFLRTHRLAHRWQSMWLSVRRKVMQSAESFSNGSRLDWTTRLSNPSCSVTQRTCLRYAGRECMFSFWMQRPQSALYRKRAHCSRISRKRMICRQRTAASSGNQS